jgi:hypothetical protein
MGSAVRALGHVLARLSHNIDSITRRDDTNTDNCYDRHCYGASRYVLLFHNPGFGASAYKLVDRREHRQQRVRGAG